MKQRSEHPGLKGLRVRIRVGGQLDAGWSSWFDGLAVNPLASGEADLSGIVADQASLHGLLSRIRDLGVPLLGLEVIDAADVSAPDEASPSRPKGSERRSQPRSGSLPT